MFFQEDVTMALALAASLVALCLADIFLTALLGITALLLAFLFFY